MLAMWLGLQSSSSSYWYGTSGKLHNIQPQSKFYEAVLARLPQYNRHISQGCNLVQCGQVLLPGRAGAADKAEACPHPAAQQMVVGDVLGLQVVHSLIVTSEQIRPAATGLVGLTVISEQIRLAASGLAGLAVISEQALPAASGLAGLTVISEQILPAASGLADLTVISEQILPAASGLADRLVISEQLRPAASGLAGDGELLHARPVHPRLPHRVLQAPQPAAGSACVEGRPTSSLFCSVGVLMLEKTLWILR